MTSAGIDLGGTKIEAQVFAPDWTMLDRRRVDTPRDYNGLLAAMADLIAWIDATTGAKPAIGVAAAGLVNPATGLAYTANLPATGQPFPADISHVAGRHVTYVNDCRALTLSEAIFGAAKGLTPVVGLILGTGIGGGVAVEGRLIPGPAMVGGEFGHTYAPAHLVAQHGLPIVKCGCGRMACIETLIAGPGLTRIAETIIGRAMSPRDIVAAKATDQKAARTYDIWCALVAELLMTLTFTIDPAAIVLGGGLSNIPGLIADLTAAQSAVQLPGFATPRLLLAQGGDSSGARGAAYAAQQEVAHV
jgi:N-acetylglucosamine kinase